MKDDPIHVKRRTDSSVEHINVPAGEGYTRWHYIVRSPESDSLGVGDDADGGRALHPTQSRFHQMLNLLKRKLFIWR
jgi:hypothetical protein